MEDQINKEETAILLGNGIILSHSKGKEFNFKLSAIKGDLIDLYNQNYSNDKFDLDCPEKLLNLVRVELIYEILNWYKRKFEKLQIDGEIGNLQKFISDFKNIFTLNYDPITYRSIFSNNGTDARFKDGFSKDANTRESIRSAIGEKGIYYLHGAFHIVYVFDDKGVETKHLYRKIAAKNGRKLMESIIDEHENIIRRYRDNLQHRTQTLNYEDVICVLEANPVYKKAWINRVILICALIN